MDANNNIDQRSKDVSTSIEFYFVYIFSSAILIILSTI